MRPTPKLVRHTERQLLARGQPIQGLGQQAQQFLAQAHDLPEAQRERLTSALTVVVGTQAHIHTPSQRLTHGTKLRHCTRVHAYDPPIAPMMEGKSNCLAQCGRTPGIVSDPATGCIFAHRVPEGNPSDAGSVLPLLDKVQGAIARVQTAPRLQVHAVAGDLGLNDAALRQALHARGMLTVGIPKTVAPIQPHPSPQEVLDILNEAGLHRKRTPHHVHLACLCGSRRPVVESHSASVRARGAGQVHDKSLQGAVVQLGMTVMAHHSAVGVRIRQQHLSKRAQKFRRLLGLKLPKINEISHQKN